MLIKKIIPSFLTSINILLGSVSVFNAFQGKYDLAIYFILAAVIFDFADGFTARILNTVSEFGKQLDSLSDLISFGFAPAILLHIKISEIFYENTLLKFLPALIIVFSAIRLAKFNIDETQTNKFKGLPTPANAIFLATLLHSESLANSSIIFLFNNEVSVFVLVIISSIMLILPITLFSLKIKKINLKENIFQILLLISGFILYVFWGFLGISFSIILYIVLSIFKTIFEKIFKHK